MAPDDVDVVLDRERETEAGNVVRVKAMRVPKSEKFPEGVKYRFHYGTKDGDTILRYDNSHGVHERHTPDGLDEIDYPDGGVVELYDRFLAAIE